ncbi:MAG: hypothetical protein RSB38_07480 [Oscillospiraceae bacterium]
MKKVTCQKSYKDICELNKELGFDYDWFTCYIPETGLFPGFEPKIIKELPDGSRHVMDHNGVTVLEKDDAGSIPAEIEHTLVDRKSYENHYKPKLVSTIERQRAQWLKDLKRDVDYENDPVGLYCGSLYGQIRDWMGIVGLSYLFVDDEELLDEIIADVAHVCYDTTKDALKYCDIKFDFGHFWEDICFKNGPLVRPEVFYDKTVQHYKKITNLLNENDINIVSLDCDGCIDALIPTWLDGGVNTMFPIEVGTWEASLAPWREKYGKKIRGVGGMNKNVFSMGFSEVDAEIERLRPLIQMGGYIPCPDHRIPPDAKFENVKYYCAKMRKLF